MTPQNELFSIAAPPVLPEKNDIAEAKSLMVRPWRRQRLPYCIVTISTFRWQQSGDPEIFEVALSDLKRLSL